jgi:predicted RNase H-like nuclease (RuvC/YqgF family)
MDAKHEEIVGSLRQRIRTIIDLYEEQRNTNTKLQVKNQELQKQINILENKLEDLDKKYENLKTAKVLSSLPGEDVHATKLQVNRIVREIDKCIALLNR